MWYDYHYPSKTKVQEYKQQEVTLQPLTTSKKQWGENEIMVLN